MLKQKSVLFTWGLSYCVLLLLLVMFCTVLNVSAQAQLLVEYKQITRSLQQQANQAINEYFNSMEARAYNLANDYLINTFSSLTDPYGASYYHLLPIQQKLRYELLAAQEDVEI